MRKILFFLIAGLLLACQTSTTPEEPSSEFAVEFEKFTLDNGLEVIFHIDRSDPVVAVALTAHVGSAREVENRTGFAHLFEHLLFLESENLGKGGLDKLSARIGGSGANGSTSRDRTNYFQTVPKDALEKMIWAEADKLGYFINTVTEPVLAKEKQVVKNEKRQGVDNRPYGHMSSVINSNLYPKGHPYNWEVIGSLEDLQNATLQDVKDFFNRWYVPNNVTLTIAGDFDTAQAKEWVHKYFDEIPRGEEIEEQPKQMVELENSKILAYEDNFARLPRLTKAWPGVYRYHPDSYALAILTEYLARGKEAPLYQQIVETDKLADGVVFYPSNAELAGQLMLQVTAFDEVPLDSVSASIARGLEKFELEGIAQEDLDRIKAGQERAFYEGLSSVLGKGFQLAQYEIFAGDAGYITEDVQRILEVTTEDVMRVYDAYIKDKPFVAASFVPKGQLSLALGGSSPAEVTEEAIVQGAEESFDASREASYERTPSSFDRRVEPPYGAEPVITPPLVWESDLDNGIACYGITDTEVPLVRFEIRMEGGKLMDEPEKLGSANLLAQLMTKGTAKRTPAELEKAIALLGSSISAYATDTAIIVSGVCLGRNFEPTVKLVREILAEPRWDQDELDLILQSVKSQLRRQMANPNAIANNEFGKLLYGENHPMARNLLGSTETLDNMTMADLQQFYSNKLSASTTRIHLVGAIDQSNAETALSALDMSWAAPEVSIPQIPEPAEHGEARVYFYDVPDAKQSVLSFGRIAVDATDENFYPLNVMNYRLGGGGFASLLTQQLREGKGYTYGIRSRFSGDQYSGNFRISSGVRSNVTFESSQLVKEILDDYAQGLTEEDLEVTKSFMLKSSARSFETAQAKLAMIRNISLYGYDPNYPALRMDYVRGLTMEELSDLASSNIDPDQLIYLVVGDAATQMDRMKELGYGEAILLNGEVTEIKD